jgi:hypothetical protein
MKRHLVLGILCVSSLGLTMAQGVPQWPDGGREAKAGCRWWWHGSAVDKENLRWQMEQLAQAGIGTLEITPIYGVKGNAKNNITFLTPQWLDMLDYCRTQGAELDIDIDMTTGTGWPFGGPMVRREESASKLVTETFDIEGDGTTAKTVTLNTANGQLQRVVAFPQTTGNTVTDLTDLVDGKTLKWTAQAGKWKIIAAYCQYGVMQVKRPAPGSEGLVVDYFDKDAVANYLSYFDTKFAAGGQPWPHAFFNDSYEITQADWTRSLFDEFLKRRGYRLEEYLDLLVGVSGTKRTDDTAPNAKQVYADYRQTLADMLLDNFTRQWTQWAHSHGAITRNQAHGSPGNLIDLYAEADIPETENFYMNSFGIRGLRDDAGFYKKALSSRTTLKYASSAAHITGKPFTSSESMTWLTEHFRTSLSQMKPELDLLFTSGVNHVLFHGTAYSPREASWPGWKFYAAIDMSPTNTFWHDAPEMMKYIERVQSFLQMGQPDNDVLVYAPFANAWHKNTGTFKDRLLLFDINSMASKMGEMEQCTKNLDALGLDCDYTSERYLMTTTFTDGLLVTAAGTRYKALVVPIADNLPDSVKTHLDDLQQQGATIIYGRDATALSPLISQSINGEPVEPTLTPHIYPEAMRTDMGLSVIRRSNATGHHYFIANLTPNDVEAFTTLAVPYQSAVFFNPMTGDISNATTDGDRIWLSLKSGQSLILQTYSTAVQYVATESQQPGSQQPGSQQTGSQQTAPVAELAALPLEGPWTLSVDNWTPYQIEKLQTWETLSEQAAQFMGTGIYETTFTVTARQLQSATAGFRLRLGDVRESARVWLNDVYLGCAWAVPFEVDCRNAVQEGTNSLRIEVTNLPANRIRQMDIEGQEWRIFEDINMSNISTPNYASWSLVPSGLNSKVWLVPVAQRSNALAVTQTTMSGSAESGYFPVYRVEALSGQPLTGLTMTDLQGRAFSGFGYQRQADGSLLVTVTGTAQGNVVATATCKDGSDCQAYLPAYGTYSLDKAVDFTIEEPPLGGWQKLASTSVIKGFEGTGKLPWYRSTSNGKKLTLYDGLSFESDIANYYFYFIDYGMNTNNDFRIVVDNAKAGTLCAVAYLKGEGPTVYQTADSLLSFTLCEDPADGLTIPLTGNKSMTVYRSVAVYSPVATPVAVSTPVALPASVSDIYTLQGIRIKKPTRGLYIRNGRKWVR